MFNSKEYAWKDISFVYGGRKIAIREIEFGVTRTVTDIFASGDKAHTRTKGNKAYAGRIKVLQSEAEALINLARDLYGPGADPTDLTLDGTVAFAPTIAGKVDFTQQIRAHQLVGIDITEFKFGAAQNDPNVEVDLPVMIEDVVWGA